MPSSTAPEPDETGQETPAPGPSTGQKVAAEAVGTYVLVLFGCGAAVMSGGDYVGTALAFGLAVLVAVYAFGRVSGAHLNPAVSLGAAVGGRMAWSQVPAYVGAQLLGAVLAGLSLFALFHGFEGFDAEGNMGQNFFGDDFSGYAVWAALLLELLLTAVFVLVILAVTDGRNEHPALAPLAIGMALVAIHLVAIPATGTSVNPARSIGPALFAGVDSILQLWVFVLAPLVGAALAGALYPLVFGHGTEPVPGSGLRFRRPQRAAAVPGYGAPDAYQQQWNQQGGYAGTGASTGASAWGPEPIIQDGWQWDPHAQQWIPAQQASQPGQPGQSQQPGPTGAGQWPDDGRTQIRGQ